MFSGALPTARVFWPSIGWWLLAAYKVKDHHESLKIIIKPPQYRFYSYLCSVFYVSFACELHWILNGAKRAQNITSISWSNAKTLCTIFILTTKKCFPLITVESVRTWRKWSDCSRYRAFGCTSSTKIEQCVENLEVSQIANSHSILCYSQAAWPFILRDSHHGPCRPDITAAGALHLDFKLYQILLQDFSISGREIGSGGGEIFTDLHVLWNFCFRECSSMHNTWNSAPSKLACLRLWGTWEPTSWVWPSRSIAEEQNFFFIVDLWTATGILVNPTGFQHRWLWSNLCWHVTHTQRIDWEMAEKKLPASD